MSKRRAYSQQQREQRAAQDAALSRRATEALGDTAAMSDYAARLVVMAPSVQRLSLRNQALLCTQAEDRGMELRDVATFRQWRDRGRCVRKGETGLRMVAPKGNEPAEDTTADTDSDRDDSEQDTGEHEQPRRPRFRMVSVFDISQTDGIEDEDTEPTEPDAERLLEHLSLQVTQQSDYTTEFVDDYESATIDHAACTIPVPLQALTSPEIGIRALLPAAAQVIANAVHPLQRLASFSGAATAVPETEDDPYGVGVVRLDLGEHYGTAEVTVSTDWQRGWTSYTVSAPMVSGTFVIMPSVDVRDYEQIPQRVAVHLGTPRSSGDHSRYAARVDAPTVNGIELAGQIVTDSQAVEAGRIPSRVDRATNGVVREAAPDKTQARVRAVVSALLRHWLARPDCQALREAFARNEAQGRATAEWAEAARVQARIDELIRERDQHLAVAEDQDHLMAPDAADTTPTTVEAEDTVDSTTEANEPASETTGVDAAVAAEEDTAEVDAEVTDTAETAPADPPDSAPTWAPRGCVAPARGLAQLTLI